MLKETTICALIMARRLLPAYYREVIAEAIRAIEWRKANDPNYIEPTHDA